MKTRVDSALVSRGIAASRAGADYGRADLHRREEGAQGF